MPAPAVLPHTTPYVERIRALAPHHDPRHIEAYIRVEHGTLDRLSPSAFKLECIAEGGLDMAENIAQSFGL